MLSKKESIYRPILKKSWEITWQNKYLWLFGFFAAFLGSGSVYDVVIKGWRTLNENTLYKSFTSFTAPPFEVIEEGVAPFTTTLGTTGFFAGVVLSLIAIFILYCISLLSQGGIIFSVGKIIDKKKVSLREVIDRTMSRLVHIFTLNIGAKVLVFLLLFVLSLPILCIVKKSIVLGNVLYFLIFLLLIPVSLTIIFIMIYAVAGIMTKNLLFWEAIKDSFDIFKKHWLISLEMALILLCISIATGVATTIGLILISIPLLIIGISLFFIFGEIGLISVMVFTLLFFLFTVVIIGSAFTTFQLTSWTLLYLKLSEKNALSAIIRIAKNLPKEISKKLKNLNK